MAGTMSGAGASLPILMPVKMKQVLGGLSGWRSWLAAFVAGASATLALPPVNAWPVLLLAMPILIWMLQGDRSRKSSFAIGWWFGFGFLAAGLYWISHALLIFSDRLLWMVPFAALGLPAFLAFYSGAVALALRWFRHPVIQVLAFAPLWVLGEWLRGMLFTGFPWNLIGYAWAGSDILIQPASVVGAYGLSFLVLVMAVLPALLPLVSRRVGGGLAWVGHLAAGYGIWIWIFAT
ncbi:hypothetical protein [Aestuariispira insulae]|uniref:Apolipoprotein N-acyltransferase N-terminal domain-containing protein n=1 Tax=Aestuariispira insulae TaxID=1461337 RepID=A0A3D9HPU9_9PROT|nr:hypothetical protein [Aestuariispira insulae]RED51500.1 hypothetical protein DFP90_103302 [Aestuariispira insulae]